GTRRPRSRQAKRAAPRPRRSLTPALLDLEQALLDRQAPCVAAEPAIGAYRAMAGHDERDRIRAARAADRTHRPGGADCARDRRIGARLAARNAPQRPPHAALEHRAADV